MKTPNILRKASISLSLVLLALGFSSLGFISFISKQSASSSNIFSVENAYSFVGSTFSILVGATFLFAAISCIRVTGKSEGFLPQANANLVS